MGPSSHVDVRVLAADEIAVLDDVAPGVFDGPVDPGLAAEFVADPRHHLAVALDGGRVVGMASGLHYVHPDKRPELWIDEVGVAAAHRGRGVGRALLAALLEHGRSLGCTEAWVLTEEENAAARALYAAAGGREEERPVYVTFDLGGAR